MMKPMIGLTTFNDQQTRATYVSLSSHYARSIMDAGGLPFDIPQYENDASAEDYAAALDGLVFTGGKDSDPFYYGQEPLPELRTFDAGRDAWEFALFSAAMKRGIPVMGICRGHQLINIAMGGTLYQDLRAQKPGAAAHNPEGFPVDRLFHSISISEDSLLHRVFGKSTIRVNSFHHQAVADLAPGLAVSALSPDGVIEGFESIDKGKFLVGVQFHPECLTLRFPEFSKLFRAFVDACSRR
jgi:putative glutamine amidotransferase